MIKKISITTLLSILTVVLIMLGMKIDSKIRLNSTLLRLEKSAVRMEEVQKSINLVAYENKAGVEANRKRISDHQKEYSDLGILVARIKQGG